MRNPPGRDYKERAPTRGASTINIIPLQILTFDNIRKVHILEEIFIFDVPAEDKDNIC